MHLKSRIIRTVRNALSDSFFTPPANTATDKVTQILLSLKYRELFHSARPLPSFEQVGFRAFSQNDEDGILLYIFALIGTVNRKCIEVCAGDGIECNSANLIINHGWKGLLFDGEKENVERGRRFYLRCLDTRLYPPKFVHAWIEAENINTLIQENGFAGEIDLLVVDMDGVDYWIWNAIECVTPRVVMVEYQDIWEPEIAVTVPYKRDFDRFAIHPDYFGASLAALVKLGRRKGYRLIGCNRYCFNAFFMLDGVGDDYFPEVSPGECLRHPKVEESRRTRLPQVVDLPWVEV